MAQVDKIITYEIEVIPPKPCSVSILISETVLRGREVSRGFDDNRRFKFNPNMSK